MIGYDRLRMEGPCKLKHIMDVEMSWKPGEHGTLRISGIVEEALRTNTTLEAAWQDKIALYDEEEGARKPLFKGVVTSVQTVHRNGVYTVEIEAVSGSIYSDLKKRRRSFQDTSQTYEKIITTVLRAYPGGDVLMQQGEKEKPSAPIIQYEETDWELTKRLASQFQSVVFCDILEETPKLFIGMPEGKEHKLPDGASYTVSKDLAAFQKAVGEAAGLHDTDFFGYEIQSKTFYRLGDRFKIRGYIELIVSSMTARMEKGQLIYNYRLSREAGIREQPMMNRRLSGLTLQGEILAVKGEQVQVHLEIDDKQDKGSAHWYRYAPETGSAMYSMPQVGTKANLYLADAGGQEAIVTGGVRTNGASAEKTADPNNRYFGTEHGSEMKLSPTGLEITGGSKEPLFLKLDDAVGIILSSPRKLTLTAKEEISLYTPKRVVIGAQALLVAKKTSAPSGITLEGEYNLMGAQIRTEGKDRTSYAPYDDAPVEGQPPPPPPPPEKPPFSWGKLARNVLAGLAVVAVVAVAVAFTVVTLGAGAVVVGAVLAGAAIAGTAAVVSQAVSDIARGEVSDMGTYVSTAFRETVIGAISGAVFGPFGPMASLGGRMAFGAVQNGFESVIRQTMEGKGFSFGTLALDMGIGGLTGGIMDSRLTKAIGSKIANAKIVKSLGNAFGDSLNKMTGWIGNAADAVKAKLIRDALDIKDAATTGWKKLQNALTIKKVGDDLVPAGPGGNVKLHESPDSIPSSPSQHHKDFFKESEAGKKELADRLKNEAEGKPDIDHGSTPHEHRYARDPKTGQIIEFGWVTTRAVDPIKDKVLLESAAKYKGKLSNTVLNSGKGNFCYTTVELDVKLPKDEYYAHSQVTKHSGNPNIKDISEYPENPVFNATDAPNSRGRETLRDDDTEYKILNNIAKDLGDKPDVKGKITLFTEKDTCGSCNYLISKFKEKYPNIEVEVVHNRGVEITPIK